MQNFEKKAEENLKESTAERLELDSQPKSSSRNPLKNLVGKFVFLDLNNSSKLFNRVKECLILIEAKIADCLSKDVNYVITNREKPLNENFPTSPSTPSVQNSADIQNNELLKKSKTSPNTLSFLPRTNSSINRTQAILEKANSKGNNTMDILVTARRLGIHVINVSELERYIDKYMQKKRSLDKDPNISNDDKQLNDSGNQSINKEAAVNLNNKNQLSQSFAKKSLEKLTTHKVYKLKNPFLKFESVCKQYKPIYQEFTAWHELNLNQTTSNGTHSPFQAYFSEDNQSSNEFSSSKINRSKVDEIIYDEIENKSNSSQSQAIFKSPTSSTLLNTTNASKNLNNSSCAKNDISIKTGNSILNNSSMKKNEAKIKNSSSANLANLPLNNKTNNNVGGNLVQNPSLQKQTKRKVTGYCECCKQRYDNLKQHLTSLQHENFDRNQSNFKEIDEYINGVLNFNQFLIKKGIVAEKTVKDKERKSTCNSENEQMDTESDEVNENNNLASIKEFAISFSKKRQSLGISKNQIVQALKNSNDPQLNESTLTKFERLDITPRSGAKMRPVLEKLINSSELKLSDRIKNPISGGSKTSNSMQNEISKKRKRVLTFTSEKLEKLNEAFSRNSNPSDTVLNEISKKINSDVETVKFWFSEKRQSKVSSLKKFKKSGYLSNNMTLNLIENQQNSSLIEETGDDPSSPNANSTQFLPTSNQNPTQPPPFELSLRNLNQQGAQQPLITPIRTSTIVGLKQKESKYKKNTKTPSSLSLSSPSAAVLFGLNSNSFSMPSELPPASTMTTAAKASSASKLLVSRADFLNASCEQQQQHTPNGLLKNNASISRDHETSAADLSCLERSCDVVMDALMSDFSFDNVQK